MTTDLNKLKEAHGDVIELTVPSGYKVIIRQQTGEDDDVISNPDGAFLGQTLNKFVQGIIIKSEFSDNKSPSYQDIENMKLCDKYFVIIASRIFSLGSVVKFEYAWDDGTVAEYEEDLNNYIWDYEQPFPKRGDLDYSEFRIPPHSQGTKRDMEFKISTGKTFKFDFMNGVGEKYLMTLPTSQLTKNAELRARNLQQKMGDKWVVISNFKPYTAREMVEIRKVIFDNDPIVQIITEIPHPKTKDTIQYNLLGSVDFLFPREI